MKFLFGLLFVALAACDAMRPVGAYTPDAGKPPTDLSSRPDGDSGEPDDDDAEDDVGTDDDVPEDDSDGPDQPPIDEPDASQVDPTGPFANLVDKYLMRIDQYSTASATEGSNTLTVNNRVSNLMFTTLSVDNGKLVSKEQLCFQTYEHICVKGCEPWQTTLDPGLPKIFLQKPAVEREYVVSDGQLVAPMAYMALGFDTPSGPTMSTKLPGKGDPSLWEISAGKVALRTHLVAKLRSSSGISANLDCFVTTVQLQGTAFRVDDLSGSDPLVKTEGFPLDTTGRTLATINAEDNGSSLAAREFCTVEQFQSRAGEPAPEVSVVRFARTNTANCPTSAANFEKALPAPAPYTITK